MHIHTRLCNRSPALGKLLYASRALPRRACPAHTHLCCTPRVCSHSLSSPLLPRSERTALPNSRWLAHIVLFHPHSKLTVQRKTLCPNPQLLISEGPHRLHPVSQWLCRPTENPCGLTRCPGWPSRCPGCVSRYPGCTLLASFLISSHCPVSSCLVIPNTILSVPASQPPAVDLIAFTGGPMPNSPVNGRPGCVNQEDACWRNGILKTLPYVPLRGPLPHHKICTDPAQRFQCSLWCQLGL